MKKFSIYDAQDCSVYYVLFVNSVVCVLADLQLYYNTVDCLHNATHHNYLLMLYH